MFEFNATFLIAMFSFVVFIIVMNAIFYNPILNIIRSREDYINSNYDISKEFQNKANEYCNTRTSEIDKKQEECRKQIKQALDVAHENSNKELQQARENTKQVLLSRREELTNQENEVKEVVKTQVVKDLASDIVSKILGQDSKVEEFDRNKIDRILG